MSPERRGMDDLAGEAERETNEALKDTELKLLASTTVDWKRIRPQIADQKTYDALMREVQIATAQNESLAQLKARITKLGSAGLAVVSKVLQLI